MSRILYSCCVDEVRGVSDSQEVTIMKLFYALLAPEAWAEYLKIK
jgi:hypothetical protein